MKKSIFKTTNLIGLGLILSMSACSDDDDGDAAPTTNNNSNVPAFMQSEVDQLGDVSGEITIASGYDLSSGATLAPGVYSGQIARIAQLQEIKDSSRNEPIQFDMKAALSDGSLFQGTNANSTSSIISKIDNALGVSGKTDVAIQFEELADSLVLSSQAHYTVTASNGTAGMLDRRHFSANGLEYAQIIEKGLYGALCYDQMVDDYLRPTQAGSQNTKGNNQAAAGTNYSTQGTDRQHRFDEAFGYFGVKNSFENTYPDVSQSSDGGGRFIANYTFDFSDETEAAFEINIAQKLMAAFVFGRSVLKDGEGATDATESTNETYYNAAVADIKLYTELGLAAAAYHYLNDAIADQTDAAKLHHLSEALGFIYALSFNSEGRLTASGAHDVLKLMGWSSSDSSLRGIYAINLWNVTDVQMQQAIDKLDEAYPGFSSADF